MVNVFILFDMVYSSMYGGIMIPVTIFINLFYVPPVMTGGTICFRGVTSVCLSEYHFEF